MNIEVNGNGNQVAGRDIVINSSVDNSSVEMIEQIIKNPAFSNKEKYSKVSGFIEDVGRSASKEVLISVMKKILGIIFGL